MIELLIIFGAPSLMFFFLKMESWFKTYQFNQKNKTPDERCAQNEHNWTTFKGRKIPPKQADIGDQIVCTNCGRLLKFDCHSQYSAGVWKPLIEGKFGPFR